MRLHLQMRRFYLGLHGLGLLREWPFGDPVEAEARMEAMRRLLGAGGPDEDHTLEVRDVDVLEVSDAYAEWAATYDDANPLVVAEESVLLEVLRSLPAGVAVDVAAGTGRLAARLAGMEHTVLALDHADAMLRRAAENDVDAWLVRGDILRLPLGDTSTDLVTCALALTHVADLGPAFAEFARVLRPGGVAVVSDIHPLAVATGAHAFFERGDGTRAVTRNEAHWPSDYVRAAIAAGLMVERCEEAFVDQQLLEEFGIEDMALAPDTALLGLPFVLLWVLRRA